MMSQAEPVKRCSIREWLRDMGSDILFYLFNLPSVIAEYVMSRPHVWGHALVQSARTQGRRFVYRWLMFWALFPEVLGALLHMAGFAILCGIAMGLFNRFLVTDLDNRLVGSLVCLGLAAGVMFSLGFRVRPTRLIYLKVQRKYGHLIK